MPTPRQGYFVDGVKVPSVTTILGRFKESGGLLQWAFKQGQSGAASLYEERDAAAEVGTMAHAMCDAMMTGRDPMAVLAGFGPTVQQAQKASTAFEGYKTWLATQGFTVISAEEPMVSKTHLFGGTPDFVLRMPDGRLALGDLKTSNAVYRDYLLQVAAYGILWNENKPDDPIVAGYHILRLGKEEPDFEHRYFQDLADAAELFLLLRKAYAADLALKRRAA